MQKIALVIKSVDVSFKQNRILKRIKRDNSTTDRSETMNNEFITFRNAIQ
jgi:hypothetical protein